MLIEIDTSVDPYLLIYNLHILLYFHTVHLNLYLKRIRILLVNLQYNYIGKPEILNYDFLWRDSKLKKPNPNNKEYGGISS